MLDGLQKKKLKKNNTYFCYTSIEKIEIYTEKKSTMIL